MEGEKKRSFGILGRITIVLSLIAIVLSLVSLYLSRQAEQRIDPVQVFLTGQVMVRESMVSGLRSGNVKLFCASYAEYRRIAREEPIIPESSGPIEGGPEIRLLMIDLYLISDLVEISGICSTGG